MDSQAGWVIPLVDAADRSETLIGGKAAKLAAWHRWAFACRTTGASFASVLWTVRPPFAVGGCPMHLRWTAA
jgi:hypothetical protein